MPGAGGIIDQFWISLGIKPDGSGAKVIKRQAEDAKQALIDVGTAVKVFLGGIAVKAIADVGDQFERNKNLIAGFLEATNLVGPGDALKEADKVIQSITTAAAKLPGEADDYINVFRAGLPVLRDAMPGGSIAALTDFSNTFTAIAKSLDIDSSQAARDLQLMLSTVGRAGADVKTFQTLLTFLKKLPGQANLTAESFNKMTQPQRLKLLQDAIANPGLQSILKRAGGGFDAMLGAAKSMVKTVLRLSTAGLFEGMKKGLEEIGALFQKDDGELTELGKSFVEAGKQISRVLVQLVSALGGTLKWVLKNETAMKLLKGALVLAGVALGALALQQTIGFLGKLFTAVFNLKKLLLGGLLVALVLIAEDLYTFLTGGESVIGMLLEKFPIATRLAISALAGLGAAFVAFRVGALIQFGLMATGATAAGAAVGRGFMAALGPIGIIVAALTTLYQLLDMADEKFGITEKIQRAFNVQERAPTTGSFATRSFAPGQIGAFKNSVGGIRAWNPAMSPAGGGGGDAGGEPASGATVNVGDVTIKSDNPRDAGRAFMNTIRDAQSKVSH